MSTTSGSGGDPSATRPDTRASIAAAIELGDERGVLSVYLDERGAAGAPSGRGTIERMLDASAATPPPDDLAGI